MLMRYLRSRGIAARLWLGFGVVLLLLLAIAAVGLQRLQRSGQDGAALLTRTTAVLDATSAVQVLAAQRALLVHDLVLNDNLKVQRETAGQLKSNTAQQDAALQRLAATAAASGMDEGESLLRALDGHVARLKSEEKSVLDKVADARIDEAKSLLTDTLTPRQQSLQKALREFSVAAMAAANTAVTRGEAEAQRVLLLIGGLTLLAACIGSGVAWATTRGIVRPLHAAREAALQVAQGDLTQEIQTRGNDEIAQLVGALEWMRMSLADAVKDIRNAALGVRSGAQQIERGNTGLAARTEDQAASLEETASSIEELTATVQQNAAGAGEANVLARGASDVATRGGDAVRGVVATMQGIHQSSSRIGDIIGVIDGIAFQTNILALNAAVEAARAGEQGRGFAVVASEVRSLAQRSAAAAKEIKALIDESAGRVATGVREVEGAGRTMDEIVSSVRKVDALIAEIAHASSEQLAGIEQVNRAIAQMEGNTQQNNTVVEQAAAAAEQLSQQAEVLVQTVARFKVEGAEAADLAPISGEQRDVAAGRGGVDGQRLLGAEAIQVMGAARLGAGA